MIISKTKLILIYLVVFFIIWFIIHSAVIVIDGLTDEIHAADVAVVLGNKVEANGEPSERLKSRLDKAVELYNRGYFTSIIVSGGIGIEGFDEGKVMKEYLMDQGISEENIIVDSHGSNTWMTAENTKRFMDEWNGGTVMIISQYHHLSRTKLAFKKLGMEPVASASADIIEMRDLYSIFREFFAYYEYVIRY